MYQLKFQDYYRWPIQHVPYYILARRNRKQVYIQRQTEREWELPIEPKLLKRWVQAGRFRYPLGHSRRKFDNPKRAERNQLAWLLFRQLPSCGLSVFMLQRHLENLANMGLLEIKMDARGVRYRVSLQGLDWLEVKAAAVS